MTKRIAWADTFRAIMILFIAYGHTAPEGIFKHYVYSFHVPAFLFLSGYLFKTGRDSFFPFAWKKFKSLIVPYFIFSLISIAVYVVLGDMAADGLDVNVDTRILPNIMGMLYGSSAGNRMKWNLPLWFLPCLFSTLLIAYPAARLLKKNGKGRCGVSLCAWALTFALPFLNFYLFRKRGLPYQLESAVFLMPFFIGGYLLKPVDFASLRISRAARIVIGLALIAAGACTGIFMNEEIRYFSSLYRSLPVFYASAILSILGYLLLCPMLRAGALTYIGQNTLCILLMHKFPIVLMQMLLKRAFDASEIVMTLFSLLVSAVSIALCLAAGAILNRFAPFALGRFPGREALKE